MNDNTRIIKNSGILYIRLIVTTIIGLISTRLLLKALGLSDFGLYSIVGGIVAMICFLNNVMMTTTYRYIAYEMGRKNYAGINQVFNISFIIHFFLALLLFLFAETIGIFYIYNYLNVPNGQLNDAVFVFRFSVIASFFSIISIPYQGLITAQEKFSVRASIEVIRSLLRLGAVFFVIQYLGNRLRLYSVLMMIVTIVPPILFFLYCKKKYASLIQWNFQRRWSKYKEMLGFSGWIMLGGAASIGKTQGAALIINSFFGTILNAAWSIANQVNILISMFSQNLSQAAIPQITKNYGGGNTDRSSQLVFHISKYSFFLMLIPALPILLEADYILKLWLTDVPEYASIFIKLMIVYALIETMNAGVPALIQASGKIKWFQIINSIILLLSLPVAYFLFTLGFPPYHIMVVYIFSLVLIFFTRLILLKKVIKFDIKALINRVYLKVFLVVLFLIPLFFIRNLMTESLTRLVIMTALSELLFFIIVYYVGVEKKEQGIIKSILYKVLHLKG